MSGAYEGLKEALEFVVKNTAKENQIFEIDGKVYTSQELHLTGEAEEKIYYVDPVRVTTLTGLIDYIKANRDGLPTKETLVVVESPSKVSLISTPNKKAKRDTYISAIAELPDILFDRWQDRERFIIALQTCFAPTEDRDTLLQYISHIKEEESITTTDDGISQKIVAKTGVAAVEAVILPNPVKLKPFRTFQELEQIESQFLLRLKQGGEVALYTADGGAWKNAARSAIKDYLTKALSDVPDVCIIG